MDGQDLSDFADDWHCLIARPGNGFATNGYLATGRETWAFDANSDTYVNFSGPCAFKGLLEEANAPGITPEIIAHVNQQLQAVGGPPCN